MTAKTIVLAFVGILAAFAQRPEFDVATLKLSPPPEGDLIDINPGRVAHGKVTLGNATLSDCIKFAYNLSSDAQISGPDWIRSGPTRFDIAAQAPPGTPHRLLPVMLQTLLAERLNLHLHREPRRLSFAALVVAPGGPKVRLVPPETALANFPSVPGRIISPRMSMTNLAKLLARFERETVLDMTGLDGYYEIYLEYALADAATGPSLHSALRKQLGLKLESRKGLVEVFSVESANKIPTGN